MYRQALDRETSLARVRDPKFLYILIISSIIPTAPRIPPHHPSQRDKGRGVMSSVGYLLSLLSCLVAKVLSVISCSLAE